MTKAKAKVPDHWPAAKIISMPIDKLIPYARNAREHNAAQVSQIAASMQEFGWTTPCLIDADWELIAGHGRLLAAQQLGWTVVPCMQAIGWSDEKKRAYRIADNKIALNSTWDQQLLEIEIDQLVALGMDAGLMGFDPKELQSLNAPPAEQNDITEHLIVVVCKSETEQQGLFDEFQKRGLDTKLMG